MKQLQSKEWRDGYCQGVTDERRKGLRIATLLMIVIALQATLMATAQDSTKYFTTKAISGTILLNDTFSGNDFREHHDMIMYDKFYKIAYKKRDSLAVILDYERYFNYLNDHPEWRQKIDSVMGNFEIIPVTLMCRIEGRPWAFFHDGWEVRRKRNAPAYYHQYGDTIKLEPEPCKMIGCTVNHRINSITFPVDEFIGYLDSRKRPIRKEWVVYQTFKR